MRTGHPTARVRAQQIARARYPAKLPATYTPQAFKAGLALLIPPPQAAAAVVELFENKAGWETIRAWKRKQAPQWARDLLAKKIEAHCGPLLKALRTE